MYVAKNTNLNKDFIEALKIGRFRGDKKFQDMVRKLRFQVNNFYGILFFFHIYGLILSQYLYTI
jgi:hypothetical protein